MRTTLVSATLRYCGAHSSCYHTPLYAGQYFGFQLDASRDCRRRAQKGAAKRGLDAYMRLTTRVAVPAHGSYCSRLSRPIVAVHADYYAPLPPPLPLVSAAPAAPPQSLTRADEC